MKVYRHIPSGLYADDKSSIVRLKQLDDCHIRSVRIRKPSRISLTRQCLEDNPILYTVFSEHLPLLNNYHQKIIPTKLEDWEPVEVRLRLI